MVLFNDIDLASFGSKLFLDIIVFVTEDLFISHISSKSSEFLVVSFANIGSEFSKRIGMIIIRAHTSFFWLIFCWCNWIYG